MRFNDFQDIAPECRHIYLSPHFDDIVYSCGGALAKQTSRGERVLVITVFAGLPPVDLTLSPYAQKVQHVMGCDHSAAVLIAARRLEDAQALTHLHADYLWLDHLDAIYRGAPAYYRRRRSMWGNIHPDDNAILRHLTQDLEQAHKRLPDAMWYAPLGMGYHVDHQIVFAAAEQLLQRGVQVHFYEDFPYAMRMGALRKRLREVGTPLRPVLVDVAETLQLRQEAAEMYASQVKLNFGNQDAMRSAIHDYSLGIHPLRTMALERYWTHAVKPRSSKCKNSCSTDTLTPQ